MIVICICGLQMPINFTEDINAIKIKRKKEKVHFLKILTIIINIKNKNSMMEQNYMSWLIIIKKVNCLHKI